MITPVPLLFDLVQIDRLCGPVSCRRFLKKEYLEEVAKQRILANVLRKRLALLSKLRLNGRDENPVLHSPDTRQWSAAEVPRTTYIQQVKLYDTKGVGYLLIRPAKLSDRVRTVLRPPLSDSPPYF